MHKHGFKAKWRSSVAMFGSQPILGLCLAALFALAGWLIVSPWVPLSEVRPLAAFQAKSIRVFAWIAAAVVAALTAVGTWRRSKGLDRSDEA